MNTNVNRDLTTYTPTQQALAPIDPQQLMMRAIEQGASIDTLERLVALRERVVAELSAQAFHEAMARFQSECPVIVKDKIVKDKSGRERYRYAPMDSIVAQVKAPMARAGFSFTVTTDQTDKDLVAVIQVAHISGHSQTSKFRVPMDPEAYMTDQQKWASAGTFAKRIAFSNAFGIMTGDEDNDANELAPPPSRPPVEAKVPPKPVQERVGTAGPAYDRVVRSVNECAIMFELDASDLTLWIIDELDKSGRSIQTIPVKRVDDFLAALPKYAEGLKQALQGTPAVDPVPEDPPQENEGTQQQYEEQAQ